MSRYTIGLLILMGWFVVFRMFPSTSKDWHADGPAINESVWGCGTVDKSHYGSGPIEGERAFMANCASCHNMRLDQRMTGPGLYRVSDRIPGGDWIYKWIHNSQALIESGDPYAVKVFNENGKVRMTAFPNLDKKTIDAIMAWIDGA